MKNNTDPKVYRKLAFIMFGMSFLYLFFAIGDLVIKGYSDLPPSPFILAATMGGVCFGLYLKNKVKK